MQTKLRYDEDEKEFTRIDSSVRLRSKWVEASGRYYRLNSSTQTSSTPPEELSGTVRLNLTKNWSTSYTATRDLDRDVTQRQAFGLRYQDDCTLLELMYTESRFNNDAILDSSGIGIRVSLLTLGDFGG